MELSWVQIESRLSERLALKHCSLARFLAGCRAVLLAQAPYKDILCCLPLPEVFRMLSPYSGMKGGAQVAPPRCPWDEDRVFRSEVV